MYTNDLSQTRLEQGDSFYKTYPLNKIYFHLADYCNLKCRHCWIEPGKKTWKNGSPFLDYDLFVSILEQSSSLQVDSIKLTGGEPLSHPRILDILEAIREKQYYLSLETNGTLCTKEISRKIKNCSFNTMVAVSLDGADAKTHEKIRQVPGCFDLSLNGVENLVNEGISPQIVATIFQSNKEQLDRIVRLSEKIGACSVKFNILQPVGRGQELFESGSALSVNEILELGVWVENELSPNFSIPVFYDYPMAFRPLGRSFGKSSSGCGRCGILNVIGVLSDGSYAPCGIGQTVEELIFGHAAEDDLAKVWREAKLLNQIRFGLPDKLKGVCSNCLMKSLCMGSCIAQNYFTTKDFFSSFWFCEEAYKKGVFPKKRLNTN
ncbi:SynChlorMet cassette radical SAM/SPASM protein ScmF [Desulfocicer niacini]